MEKRHFEAIAATLASLQPDRGNRYASRTAQTKGAGARAQWEETVKAMAHMCAQYNPRFDAARFLKACGLEVA